MGYAYARRALAGLSRLHKPQYLAWKEGSMCYLSSVTLPTAVSRMI